MNITITNQTPTEITGLTADKDYFIQGFYTLSSGKIIESEFALYKGEPSTGELGLRSSHFAFTKNDDIYVKALNDNLTVVIEEC